MTTLNENTEFGQEEVDLEEWTRAHPEERAPLCRTYIIRIDKDKFRSQDSAMKGGEILALVDRTPNEWNLSQKLPGGRRVPIEPDQLVDFREPGIERFETSPKNVRAGSPRRQFELPAEDQECLDALNPLWEAVIDGSQRGVVIPDYHLPPGLAPQTVDLMIRIPPAYPPATLDMFWLYPAVTRRDGKSMERLSSEMFDGRTWQRWSRHRMTSQPWRPGIDNLATHLAFVERALRQESAVAA